jgi:hypothetical protein
MARKGDDEVEEESGEAKPMASFLFSFRTPSTPYVFDFFMRANVAFLCFLI